MPAIITRDFCISSNHDAPEKRVVASSTRRDGELRGRGVEVDSVGSVGVVDEVGSVGGVGTMSKSSFPSP